MRIASKFRVPALPVVAKRTHIVDTRVKPCFRNFHLPGEPFRQGVSKLNVLHAQIRSVQCPERGKDGIIGSSIRYEFHTGVCCISVLVLVGPPAFILPANLLLILFFAFSFGSCSKKLEKFPLDEFSNENFWTSEENTMLALTAVYRGGINVNSGGSTVRDWWAWAGLLNLEVASDNAYHGQGDNINFFRLSNGTLTKDMGILADYWSAGYKRVALCNNFLDNIGKSPMADASKKRVIAEVRFIRACQYFYMSQHFGSVPLITKILSPEEANNVSKAPRPEVVNFVIDELTAAAADLPRFSVIPAKETGRASKQAALAFLGRIQMAEEKFSDAVNTYKTIIDFGDNIIDPNYSNLFIEANENSAENIFSIQYVPNLLANAFMNNNAPRVMGGFTFINPIANLMEAYQFTDGSTFSYLDPRYDYRDIGKNRDPRLKYTIYYNNAPLRDGKYISHPDSAGCPDRT